MDETLQRWAKEYNLKELTLVGYTGGYPMIQFKKEEGQRVLRVSQREINKVLRQAEMNGGFELGVGINFRKTAGIIINDETIVIYGHELVINRVLDKLL